MGFRLGLELIAIAAIGIAIAASQWLSGGNYDARIFVIWSGVALLFAAAVRFAVNHPLRQIRAYMRKLQDDPDAPAPAFHDRELNALVMAAAASRTETWSPEPAFPPEHRIAAARNVRLAREYVDGITVLIEVSRQYSTPLPNTAIRNLHYLKRLLDEAGDSLEALPEEPAALTSTTA
jgi:hypothetical protein